MIVLYNYAATIERIVDGDTLDATTDLGFRVYRKDRYRLYGINTPERGQPGWSEATDYLKHLLPAGTEAMLRSYKPELHPKADSFGRWLVDLYLGDMRINQEMIESGHAVQYPARAA